MSDIYKLNPGSKEAEEAGCTCPVIDNHYGRGIPIKDGVRWFIRQLDCPLHGEESWTKIPKEEKPL